MKRLIPDRVLKFVNNLGRYSENQASESSSPNNTEPIKKTTNKSFRKHRNDLDGVNVINIERTITSNGIIVDKEKYENIRKYIVSNIDNIAAAIEFIKTSELKEELQDINTITEIKFKFEFGSVRELNFHEIWELSGRFSNKSISLCFCTKNDDAFYIYWKPKEKQNLLFLSPFNEKFGWRDRKLCDFVMMFLKSSLKNGHSGISQSIQLPSEHTKIQLHYLSDTRGYNLVLLAAEVGDKEVVKNLLDYGINTELPNRSINAQILSYNNRHFDVLDMLLKENQAYPQSIDLSQCSEEIKKFYESSKDMHEAIIAGNSKKLVHIVMQNLKCRYFYNLRNESALKTALVHKQFKTYEALNRYGLCLAPHEDILEITKFYNETDAKNLKNIHANSSKDQPEQHMNIIIGNTSIYQEDQKTRDGFSQIYSAYRVLNANVLIKVILMIVAASKKFRVVFDLSRESVQNVDPNLSSKSTMNGRIFVGALKLQRLKTRFEAYGTLAHEFCHYAVDLTFRNDAKPYFKDDNLGQLEFDKINQECKKRYGEEEVIDLVYDCYPDDMHHAELIVRVPQLLMLYKNNPEKLAKIQEKFPKLFEFFEVRVVPAMSKALLGIVAKADVEINENEVTVRRYPKRWNFYVFYGLLVAFLTTICGLLVMFGIKSDYKFKELSEPQKLTVMHASVSYKGIDMKFIDILPYGSAGYEELTSRQLRNIFESKTLNLTGPEFSYLNCHIIHNWTTLSGPLKSKILSANFTFQDTDLKFNDLYESYPSAFAALTSNQIIDILDHNNFKISKIIDKLTGYNPHQTYISENTYLLYYKYQIEPNKSKKFNEFFETFKNENFDFFSKIYAEISKNLNEITFDSFVSNNMSSVLYNEHITHINPFKITENLDKTKTFILASDLDRAKVLEMKKLAHTMKTEYPTRWVAFVDMDKAVDVYEADADENMNKNSIFELMGRSSVTGFGQRLFDDCYKSGNLIVLWNDFYHLSPDFDDLFLDLMSDIQQNSNIQLISTKTSYSKTLRDKLHVEVHRFQPLSGNEYVERKRNQIFNTHANSKRRVVLQSL